MNEMAETVVAAEVPFDAARLDRLMDEAGIDVLLATSKHNNRYLLGGYSFLFFSAMEAIGHSRYLPVVVYAKGRPERAAYVGNSMEKLRPCGEAVLDADAAGQGLDDHRCGGAGGGASEEDRRGERADRDRAVVPAGGCAGGAGRAAAGGAFVDATGVLERLRAIKTPAELGKLREGSERITEAMLATIGWAREGTTKAEIIERLRREEVAARAAFRLLPADARGEPQPGAVGAGLGEGRGAVDRFGRQPRRLYRRPGADGGAGGAGRGA